MMNCSHGILHFIRKKGVPCFIFIVDLKTGREIYTATMKKTGRSLDFVYLFYSCNSPQQNFVGKMKISSSSSYNPDRSRLTETRFVLFGSNEFQLRKSKKGLFRSKSRIRKEIVKYLTEQPDESVSGSEDPNLEMAAGIVRRREELACGGWGLKFLRLPAAGESSPATVVVFAAGVHGGPAAGTASLTERWKSGGRCDCGGWDLGCPIKILNSKEEERRERILDFFTQGKEERERGPALRVEGMKDGIFRVSFREGISAIQSFSAAVALIHARTPAPSGFTTPCYEKKLETGTT